jgi:hypothetical protein
MARAKKIENLEPATAHVETLPAAVPKRKRAPRKPKSLKDTIATAVTKAEKDAAALQNTSEVTLKNTGEIGYLMPWAASGAPRPWSDGYSRVVIPLKTPTKRGARCKTLIVRNDNLVHGRARAA